MSGRARSHQLWILEDHLGVQQVIHDALCPHFEAKFLNDLAELQKALDGGVPPLLLADLLLPDGSFLDWLRQGTRKQRLLDVPFMVISGFVDLAAFRVAFAQGAIDYIVKPFSKDELLAKVENALSRVEKDQPSDELSSGCLGSGSSEPPKGAWALDAAALVVSNGSSHSAPLTAKEFQIMTALQQAQGYKLTKHVLCQRVWGPTKVTSQTLNVHLTNLRRKLADIGFGIYCLPSGEYQLIGADDKMALPCHGNLWSTMGCATASEPSSKSL